jgi:glycosyltransferase involved in cell wall biosynthesis
LDSLAAQTWPNLEILISDDASPDETAGICETYVMRDARFHLIRQPRNLGWIRNTNALLHHLLFAFQDDPLDATYIEKCVAALEANPGAIVAYADIARIWPDGRREELSYPALGGGSNRLRQAARMARKEGCWWIPNRGVFRARAGDAIGGLRTHLAGEYCADWPWLLHMSLLGDFVRVPDRLVTKFCYPHSRSRTWRLGLWPSTAVTLSASAAVLRARVPWNEKLVLNRILYRGLLGSIHRQARMTAISCSGAIRWVAARGRALARRIAHGHGVLR